jgi:hypothetical protein
MTEISSNPTVVVESPNLNEHDVDIELVKRGYFSIKDLNTIYYIKPKPSCRKCYGRGLMGTLKGTNQEVRCHCIMNGFQRAKYFGVTKFR